MKVQISELSNGGDARGFSFTVLAQALEFVGCAADVRLASTKPNAVRGNYFHLKRREAIVVMPGSRWSLHWDEGAGTSTEHRVFNGSCAVLVLAALGASHAVRNDGADMLWLAAISSKTYDPAETVARKVV